MENRECPRILGNNVDYHKQLVDELAKVSAEKSKLEDELNDGKPGSKNEFSLKEQYDIYSIVNELIKQESGDYTFAGVNLVELRNRITEVFSKVFQLVKLNYDSANLERQKRSLLEEGINLDLFSYSYVKDSCNYAHMFIRLRDELRCVCCGATSKMYDLTEDQLDFLTKAASVQNMLLDGIGEEDLPLLKVLMEREAEYRRNRPEATTMDEMEEEYLDDVSRLSDYERQVRQAHMYDRGIYSLGRIRIKEPYYLEDEKAKKMLDEVDAEIARIRNTDSRFKDLMIEECLTAKYEIMMLAGDSIPWMYSDADTEDKKIAIAKAYYNLSNILFRQNSDYFAGCKETLSYHYLTADPDINNKVLELKAAYGKNK